MPKHNPPYVLYQKISLDVNFNSRTINGSTSILLAGDIQEDSFLRLNSRNCDIEEIILNDQVSTFEFIDPLKNLLIPKATTLSNNYQYSYNAEELDINYRAALEVSRFGELSITLPPKLFENKDNFNPLKILSEIPTDCPTYVTANYEKLRKDTKQLLNESSNKYLLIQIKYSIKQPKTGLSFRNFLHTYHNNNNTTPPVATTTNTLRNLPIFSSLPSQAADFFVTTYGQLLFHNVDGCRNLFPCLDFPDRRTFFDLSISTPIYMSVLTSGVLISENIIHPHDEKSLQSLVWPVVLPLHQPIKITRYLTATRIPASTIGLFIGPIERYKMNLYRAYGEFWITHPILNKNKSVELLAKSDKGSVGVSNIESLKKLKYEKAVRHTVLGLELACRHSHKYVGKRYQHAKYTEVFVEDLGVSYLSYDGFSLIDKKFLHTSNQIYLEFPSHITQFTAYLTSWLCTGIPIDTYHSEFLIHGTVGYLINRYIDFVLTSEEARYRFLKQYETIIQYEKTGQSFPMCPDFPEAYEIYLPQHIEYFKSKSLVIFHIIEHRLKSKDLMRQAIKRIIMTPAMSTNQSGATTKSGYPGTMPATPGTPWHSTPSTPFPSTTPSHSIFAPPTPVLVSQTPSTPYQSFEPPTPLHPSYAPPTPQYENYLPPTPSHEMFPPPTPAHDLMPPPTPLHEMFPPPTPSHETYFPPPTPSHDMSLPVTPSHEMIPPPTPSHPTIYIPNTPSTDPFGDPATPLVSPQYHPSTPSTDPFGPMTPLYEANYGGGNNGNSGFGGGTLTSFPSNDEGDQDHNHSLVISSGRRSSSFGTSSTSFVTPVTSIASATTTAAAPSTSSQSSKPAHDMSVPEMMPPPARMKPLNITIFPGTSSQTNKDTTTTTSSSTPLTLPIVDHAKLAMAAPLTSPRRRRSSSLEPISYATSTSGNLSMTGLPETSTTNLDAASTTTIAAADTILTTVYENDPNKAQSTTSTPLTINIDNSNNSNFIGFVEGKENDTTITTTTTTTTAAKTTEIVPIDTSFLTGAEGGFISGLHFMNIIGDVGGGATGKLSEIVLVRWLKQSGALFLRAGANLDRRIKGSELVEVAFQQIGWNKGEISDKYSYSDSIDIRVVENYEKGNVWDYSKRVEIGKAQAHSIPTKKKRIAPGRKKNIVPTQQAAYTVLDSTVLFNQDDGSSTSRQPEYRLISLQIARGSGTEPSPVQFVAFDPDVYWIREIRVALPVLMLLEQLAADEDVFGQWQAIKGLEKPAAGYERGQVVLCVQGLADCMNGIIRIGSTGFREGNNQDEASNYSAHCVYIRGDSAFALANWQCTNCPKKGLPDSSCNWQGLYEILSTLRKMFVDSDELPSPNDFQNDQKTTLRNMLLLALSTIKSREGYTPIEIINILLLFAENNNNNNNEFSTTTTTSTTNTWNLQNSCHQVVTSISLDSLENQLEQELDDTYYCCILLLALSRIKIDKNNKSSTSTKTDVRVSYLQRILNFALLMLNNDVMVASAKMNFESPTNDHDNDNDIDESKYPTQSTTGTTTTTNNNNNMDIEMEECKVNIPNNYGHHAKECTTSSTVISTMNSPYSHLPAGGILTVCALQCLCALDQQIILSSSSSRNSNGSADQTTTFVGSVNYHYYLSSFLPYFIRVCALECCLHISFVKYLMKSKLHPNDKNISLTPIVDALNLLFDVIETDTNIQVKSQGAVTLLDVLQDRPQRSAVTAIALGEYFYCYGGYDPTGNTVPPNKRYQKEYKEALLQVDVEDGRIGPLGRVLTRWWDVIRTCGNQSIRAMLLTAWLYVFESSPPPCLMTTATKEPLQDHFFQNSLPNLRLKVCEPWNCDRVIDEELQYGTSRQSFEKYHKGYVTNPTTTGNTTTGSTISASSVSTTNNSNRVIITEGGGKGSSSSGGGGNDNNSNIVSIRLTRDVSGSGKLSLATSSNILSLSLSSSSSSATSSATLMDGNSEKRSRGDLPGGLSVSQEAGGSSRMIGLEPMVESLSSITEPIVKRPKLKLTL